MAARNATLTFGLISVAAKLEVATESKVSMSNLCVGQPNREAHDALPVKMPKTCESCGPIVDAGVLVKGVKQGKSFVIVDTEAAGEAMAAYASQYAGINLVPHPASEFMASTAQGDSLHYVTPADAAGAGHYQLLVRLIESHPELAFASLYTPVSATSLYVARVRDGVLVLEKRTREQSMRPTPSVGGVVNDALYSMLEGTLEQFVTPYDAASYEDTYAETVKRLLAEGEVVAVGDDKAATPVPIQTDADLMTKLRALSEVA